MNQFHQMSARNVWQYQRDFKTIDMETSEKILEERELKAKRKFLCDFMDFIIAEGRPTIYYFNQGCLANKFLNQYKPK